MCDNHPAAPVSVAKGRVSAPVNTRACVECGATVTVTKHHTTFCSTPCRKAFNNRRMIRGAELYDLMMSLRYNREEAKTEGAWTIMCRMAEAFREEDHCERSGRQSWTGIRALKRTGRLAKFAYLTKTYTRAGK